MAIAKMKLIDITVKRTIPASADKVFDVWMEPKCPSGSWFGSSALIMTPMPLAAVPPLLRRGVDGHTLGALRTPASSTSGH